MQHAWKHVERPGGSHTALDGKKLPAHVCPGVLLDLGMYSYEMSWPVRDSRFLIRPCHG